MSIENGWDGLHYKTGNKLPLGTYVYEIYFQDFEGWKHRKTSNSDSNCILIFKTATIKAKPL